MTASHYIDLNADLGEGVGDDAAMLELVSSASVACGAHAGGPDQMFATMQGAVQRGVAVGAHPGFADRANFGRLTVPMTAAEVERLVAFQLGAACGIAALAGARVRHVKAHGALYNLAAADEAVARAVARGVRAVDPALICLVPAASLALRVAEAEGMAVAAEIFADRAYRADGSLVPRGLAGAVIHDAEAAADRVLAMLAEGALIAADGTRLAARIDSVCVHGDTPGAVGLARRLREALLAAGHRLRAFAP